MGSALTAGVFWLHACAYAWLWRDSSIDRLWLWRGSSILPNSSHLVVGLSGSTIAFWFVRDPSGGCYCVWFYSLLIAVVVLCNCASGEKCAVALESLLAVYFCWRYLGYCCSVQDKIPCLASLQQLRSDDLRMGNCPHRPPPRAPARANGPVASTRAQRRWQWAVRRIHRLLHVRRVWACLGQYLNSPEVLQVTLGLERKKGLLQRVQPASVVARDRVARAAAKASAKAQAQFQQ